jgi:hypothetical protein
MYSERPYCCRGAAKNTFYLKKVGVTHVLNTAEGQRQGTVDTSQVEGSPLVYFSYDQIEISTKELQPDRCSLPWNIS